MEDPFADPPHQRMEPENGFDEHLHQANEIVAASNVAKLMREDGRLLLRRQVFQDPLRQQEHLPKHAENTRLEERWRRYRPNRKPKL
jgi:hypothetical protein